MSEKTVERKLLKQVLDKISSLPPLPAAVQKLIRMSDDDRVRISEISKVISVDHSLTAKFLQVANSPYYGMAHKISTINQAIMIIGMRDVKSIALMLSVVSFGDKKNQIPEFNVDDFWRHSIATAIAAKEIAMSLDYEEASEELFVGGLLHDMGKLVMAQYFPDIFGKIVEQSNREMQSFDKVENTIIEFNHTELAKELCQHWKIPESIARMVQNHHCFPPMDFEKKIQDKELLFNEIVAMANQLAKITRVGDAGNALVSRDFLQRLHQKNYPANYLAKLILSLQNQVKQMESRFGLESKVQEPASDAPLSVGIALTDESEFKMVNYVLLAMGFMPLEIKTETSSAQMPDAVIVDQTSLADPAYTNLLDKIKLKLNFQEWKRSLMWTDSCDYPVNKLEQWLKQGLIIV